MADKKTDLRSEKRKLGTHSILVCYPTQDGSDKKEKHSCNSEDISEGGLKVITRRPLPLGCLLPIEVKIVDLNAVFRFNGEVKWCLELDAAPTFSAGIKLQKLSENNYQQWRQIVNENQ